MKISILTPSFNTNYYIRKNVDSVLNQGLDDLEHIIIDGGSTDGTVETLKSYPHLKWVSESDEGQSHALNKGLAMAEGDIIGWINSDDYYCDDVLKDVLRVFEDSKIQWVVGNSIDFYQQIDFKKVIISKEVTYHNLLKDTKMVRQPPTFFRKSFIENAGFVINKYHYVMDYELWVRLSKISEPFMLDKVISVFRIHAEQKTAPLNRVKFIKEKNQILKTENVPIIYRMIALRPDVITIIKAIIKGIMVKIRLLNSDYLTIPTSITKSD